MLRRWAFAVFAAMMATGLARAGEAPKIRPIQPSATVVPLSKIAPGAERVTVGVYPTTVYELSVESSTYFLRAYVWLRWKGDIDPSGSLEFTNVVDQWGLTRTNILEKPQTLPDGSQYQIMLVQGRFFQPFSLIDYPLDHQTLSLSVEDSTWGEDKLVYVPDETDSGYSAMLKIPGWNLEGWRAHSTVQDYASRFGETGKDAAARFAGLKFELVLARPISYFLWKLLLPLLIVLTANWLVLLLKPEHIEVRTALPATALLTLVFLQKSYSDTLPAIGALVLMDKIYAVAYVVVIATMVQVIANAKWLGRNVEQAAVIRWDRRSLILQVALFAVWVAVLALTIGRV